MKPSLANAAPQLYVGFSNRPVEVKRFQTIHDCGVASLAGSCFSAANGRIDEIAPPMRL
jgi:hypothetical protein